MYYFNVCIYVKLSYNVTFSFELFLVASSNKGDSFSFSYVMEVEENHLSLENSAPLSYKTT